MEFNDELRQIQVTMVHCNEFAKNFEKMQFRGGKFFIFLLNSQLILIGPFYA
jgi:hypothetical protein